MEADPVPGSGRVQSDEPARARDPLPFRWCVPDGVTTGRAFVPNRRGEVIEVPGAVRLRFLVRVPSQLLQAEGLELRARWAWEMEHALVAGLERPVDGVVLGVGRRDDEAARVPEGASPLLDCGC